MKRETNPQQLQILSEIGPQQQFICCLSVFEHMNRSVTMVITYFLKFTFITTGKILLKDGFKRKKPFICFPLNLFFCFTFCKKGKKTDKESHENSNGFSMRKKRQQDEAHGTEARKATNTVRVYEPSTCTLHESKSLVRVHPHQCS